MQDFIFCSSLISPFFSNKEYKSLLKVEDTISGSVHKPVGRDNSDTTSKTPLKKNNNKKKKTTLMPWTCTIHWHRKSAVLIDMQQVTKLAEIATIVKKNL